LVLGYHERQSPAIQAPIQARPCYDCRASQSRFGSWDAEQHLQTGAVAETRKGKGQVESIYRFLIIIEKANGNYSAYSPDLPGCVATGETHDEVTRNMYEAIEMHVRGLIEDELPVPESHSLAEYVALPSVAL
jgi:predicted RNase H-like HicB family nuclease